MAAFVVASSIPRGAPETGTRLDIFPGSVTPAVFAAHEPFWVGYGFVCDPDAAGGEEPEILGDGTRFELVVDGRPVALTTDTTMESGRTVSKSTFAYFADGLGQGWHMLTGRWYDAGRLVLTNQKAIEFVES